MHHVLPALSRSGNTVTVHGRNFAPTGRGLACRFGSLKVTAIFINVSAVRCVPPAARRAATVAFSVSHAFDPAAPLPALSIDPWTGRAVGGWSGSDSALLAEGMQLEGGEIAESAEAGGADRSRQPAQPAPVHPAQPSQPAHYGDWCAGQRPWQRPRLEAGRPARALLRRWRLGAAAAG